MRPQKYSISNTSSTAGPNECRLASGSAWRSAARSCESGRPAAGRTVFQSGRAHARGLAQGGPSSAFGIRYDDVARYARADGSDADGRPRRRDAGRTGGAGRYAAESAPVSGKPLCGVFFRAAGSAAGTRAAGKRRRRIFRPFFEQRSDRVSLGRQKSGRVYWKPRFVRHPPGQHSGTADGPRRPYRRRDDDRGPIGPALRPCADRRRHVDCRFHEWVSDQAGKQGLAARGSFGHAAV